jgi:hypothetical protein
MKAFRFLCSLILVQLTVLTFSLVSAADPQLSLGKKIYTSELGQISSSFSNSVECHELEDRPAVYVCLAENQDLLRRLMGRVSYFVEGVPGDVVVAEDNQEYLKSTQANYDGHDIMAEDFLKFFSVMDKQCPEVNYMCPNTLESDLREHVIGDALRNQYQNYVVIAVVAKTSFFSGIVSHELLHARFFLSDKYQSVVDKFWRDEVSAEDRLEITRILGEVYNLKNNNGYFLLLNEFQAYLLEDSASDNILGSMATKYGQRLREELAQIEPEF